MADIMHLVRLTAESERAFAAVATPEGVRSWWTEDADLDLVQGGVGEFRFYGGEKATRVRIEVLDPPARIVWRVVRSFRPEWEATAISFDLRPEAQGTTLLFAHRGFPRADEDYALCTTGWGVYLGRLQAALQA